MHFVSKECGIVKFECRMLNRDKNGHVGQGQLINIFTSSKTQNASNHGDDIKRIL